MLINLIIKLLLFELCNKIFILSFRNAFLKHNFILKPYFSNLQPSNSYRSGDGIVNTTPNKLFHDIIRSAAIKSGIKESKIMQLLHLANPCTDSEIGKKLQIAYKKQVLIDLKKVVLNDINYDKDKFQHLNKYYSSY